MGYFPIDEETIRYYRLTGRDEAQVDLIERYMKAQKLFLTADAPVPDYSDTVELDLADVVPSLSGPRRPQDRVAMSELKKSFQSLLTQPAKEGGFELGSDDVAKTVTAKMNGGVPMGHGSTVIAAIRS